MCIVIRTHLATHFFLVGGGGYRYVVHRHVLCVVIRAYLDTRFFPVRGVDHLVVHRHVMCVVIRPQLVPLILCAGT